MTETAPPLAHLQEQAWQLLTDFSVALTELIGRGAKAARQGLRQLPLAEAMLRRLIYLMALEIDIVPADLAPAPKPDGGATGLPTAPALPSERMPRFRLLDPLPLNGNTRPLLPEHLRPRITLMDSAAQAAPLPEDTPARPANRTSPEIRFSRRIAALTDAFLHMETYAARMARWMARQKAARAARTQPLSPQLPPVVYSTEGDPFTNFLFNFHCQIMALTVPDTS